MGLRASVAVFVVSLLLSLVIWAPVSVVVSLAERQLGMQLPVKNEEGTLWQGEAQSSVNNVTLTAQWQYQFPLSWQLNVSSPKAGELDASISPLSTSVNNLTGEIKAAWLLDQIEPMLGGPLLDAPGTLDILGLSAELSGGQLVMAEGTISYDGGIATYNLFVDRNVPVPPMTILLDTLNADDSAAVQARLLRDDGVLMAQAEVSNNQANYTVYNSLMSTFGMSAGNPVDVYLENTIAMPALGM